MGDLRYRVGLLGLILGLLGLVAWFRGMPAARADLLVGTATAEITPSGPVALRGQFHLRISQAVETPLVANVLAIESREHGRQVDAAVFVACDVVVIEHTVRDMVRQAVKQRIAGLDPRKVVLTATHTHTGPTLVEGQYQLPDQGVTPIAEYRRFFVEQVAEAIEQAWKRRASASFTWGLSHAVVGYNRRAVYADGSARMYGATNLPAFRSLEGYEDHDIGTLFFWNQQGKLTAIVVNVACPAQEVESRSAVNADFWHPVRESLRARYGRQVCVLGWISAAGDQSPHLMYRHQADERMRRLRGLSRLEEIARRITSAVNEAYEVVKDDRHANPTMVHRVLEVDLPMRRVSEAEYAEARSAVESARAAIEKNPAAADRLFARMKWFEETVRRYEQQQDDPQPVLPVEIHVVRLGEVAVCTNRFELFADYGIRIKARSKAGQTFVVQLAGPGTYLPTAKAVRGGGYSAVVHSSLVGPEGGKVLVDRTVAAIEELWTEN